ncbi:hypothetical protein [Listeria valentina]|uniref:hypothetical protein n=1 Tax=Listeria valentina TaxID=2705293 RepID=UPI001431EC69|nr:hypothetical protein [Listeria valentina]
MKKWLLASLGLLLALGLSACGDAPSKEKEEGAKANTTDVKKASAYPEADEVAKQAFQASVDFDARVIYEDLASEKLQKYLIPETPKKEYAFDNEVYGDSNFSSLDKESIKKEEVISPGDYQKLIDSKDYFFAVYDQYKTKGVLDYILIGKSDGSYTLPGESNTVLAELYPDNTDYYVFKLELIKEHGDWKLSSYNDWPYFNETNTKKREARIREMVKGDDKRITVLHRGENFTTDSN